MDWQGHRYWAGLMGISAEAARFANRVIDLVDGDELPEDYRDRVSKYAKDYQEMEGAKGNSALHMVITNHVLSEHDGGRQLNTAADITAEIQLEIMEEMDQECRQAWYLHHHLDYLHEERDSGKSIEALLEEHKEKYPQAYSEEAESFILEQKNEIAKDLGIFPGLNRRNKGNNR